MESQQYWTSMYYTTTRWQPATRWHCQYCDVIQCMKLDRMRVMTMVSRILQTSVAVAEAWISEMENIWHCKYRKHNYYQRRQFIRVVIKVIFFTEVHCYLFYLNYIWAGTKFIHWIVGLYYYGFLVNEGICLILVIQTFDPSILSVLYNKDVYPTSAIVWSTTFPFNIFKSH